MRLMSCKGWTSFCFVVNVITTLNTSLALSASLIVCIEWENIITLVYFGLCLLQDFLQEYLCM